MTNSLTMAVCFVLDVFFMLLVLFQHSSVSVDGSTTSNILRTNSSVSCVKSDYVTPDINVICNCSVDPDIPLIVRWEVIENGNTTTVTFCTLQNGTTQNGENGSQPTKTSPHFTDEVPDMCIQQNPMTLALPTLMIKDMGLSGKNITCMYETHKGLKVQVGDYIPHLAYGPDDVKLISPNNKYRPDNDDTMTLVCKAKGMPKPTFIWEGHPESSTIMRHCVMDTPDNDVYDSTLTFSHADLAEGHLINCTVTVAAEDWTNSTANTFVLKDAPNPMLSTENIYLYVGMAVAFLLCAGLAVVVTCQYVHKRRDRGTADAEEAPPPNPPPNHSLERSLPQDIRRAQRPDDAGGEPHTSRSRSDVSEQPRSRSGAFRPDDAGGEPHTSRSRSGVSEEERSRSEVREHHSLPTPTPVSEHSLHRDREGGLEGSINQETLTSSGLPADQTPPEPAIFAAGDEEPFQTLVGPGDNMPLQARPDAIFAAGDEEPFQTLVGPGDSSPSPEQSGLDNLPPQTSLDDDFHTADDLDLDHDDETPLLLKLN